MSASAADRRVRVTIDCDSADTLGFYFNAVGALEVAAVPAPRPSRLVTVTARFAATEPGYLEDRVESWLHPLDPASTATVETARGEGPWLPGWRALYEGATVGRFRIRPPWTPPLPPDAGLLDIAVDPRGGFGSGLHPTTVTTLLLAQEELAARPPPTRVLDVGAGNGILSIAAARLGHEPTAVELESAAREACRRHAAANGVAVRVVDEPLERLGAAFPVVLANLNSYAVVALAPALAGAVEPGGTLVLGGFHPPDLPRVRAAYPEGADARPQTSADGDWAGVALRFPASRT